MKRQYLASVYFLHYHLVYFFISPHSILHLLLIQFLERIMSSQIPYILRSKFFSSWNIFLHLPSSFHIIPLLILLYLLGILHQVYYSFYHFFLLSAGSTLLYITLYSDYKLNTLVPTSVGWFLFFLNTSTSLAQCLLHSKLQIREINLTTLRILNISELLCYLALDLIRRAYYFVTQHFNIGPIRENKLQFLEGCMAQKLSTTSLQRNVLE